VSLESYLFFWVLFDSTLIRLCHCAIDVHRGHWIPGAPLVVLWGSGLHLMQNLLYGSICPCRNTCTVDADQNAHFLLQWVPVKLWKPSPSELCSFQMYSLTLVQC
jgi:hypothetical protein